MMKKNLFEFNDATASFQDWFDEILGHKVSLQLISAVNLDKHGMFLYFLSVINSVFLHQPFCFWILICRSFSVWYLFRIRAIIRNLNTRTYIYFRVTRIIHEI